MSAEDAMGAQFAALHRLRRMPEVIQGRTAKKLMAEYGIRSHAYREHEDVSHYAPDTHTIYGETELHTAQKHLHRPTLEKYIREGHAHLEDPDYGHGMPYHPQVYRDLDKPDQHWIDEGHHRIMASRMRGDRSVTAYYGEAR